jgi:hypothetical protein
MECHHASRLDQGALGRGVRVSAVVGDICGVGHPSRIDAKTAQAAGAGTRAIDCGSTARNVRGSAADNYGDCHGDRYREAQRYHYQAHDRRRKA